MDGSIDVLQVASAHVREWRSDFPGDLLVDSARQANAARFGDLFEPRRDVDAVAIDILTFDDDVADVDPDSQADRIDLGVAGIVIPDQPLNFDGEADGIHCTRKLHQRTVANELDDSAGMGRDRWIENPAS